MPIYRFSFSIIIYTAAVAAVFGFIASNTAVGHLECPIIIYTAAVLGFIVSNPAVGHLECPGIKYTAAAVFREILGNIAILHYKCPVPAIKYTAAAVVSFILGNIAPIHCECTAVVHTAAPCIGSRCVIIADGAVVHGKITVRNIHSAPVHVSSAVVAGDGAAVHGNCSAEPFVNTAAGTGIITGYLSAGHIENPIFLFYTSIVFIIAFYKNSAAASSGTVIGYFTTGHIELAAFKNSHTASVVGCLSAGTVFSDRAITHRENASLCNPYSTSIVRRTIVRNSAVAHGKACVIVK